MTPDGVIVTDPINQDAAIWLRDEIKRRFDKPIHYLIYSHDHRDHSAGGEVFAIGGTIIIGGENTKRAIIAEGRPTAVPMITFKRRMSVYLGGKTVELTYVGRDHSDNSIIITFPDERVLSLSISSR